MCRVFRDRRAAICASKRNLAAACALSSTTSPSRLGVRSLSATCSPSVRWCATQTSPIEPRPRRRTSSNFPATTCPTSIPVLTKTSMLAPRSESRAILRATKERHQSRPRAVSHVTHAADDPHTFAVAVGEGVRRARQANGWTQVELAEAAGLSPNYVARLERGELGASLFVAYQLSRTLGISVRDLVDAPLRTTRRRMAG